MNYVLPLPSFRVGGRESFVFSILQIRMNKILTHPPSPFFKDW